MVRLRALVVAAVVALAVRNPSAYWIGPAASAVVAVFANRRTRSPATSAATLGVLLCSSGGMLVVVSVPVERRETAVLIILKGHCPAVVIRCLGVRAHTWSSSGDLP